MKITKMKNLTKNLTKNLLASVCNCLEQGIPLNEEQSKMLYMWYQAYKFELLEKNSKKQSEKGR